MTMTTNRRRYVRSLFAFLAMAVSALLFVAATSGGAADKPDEASTSSTQGAAVSSPSATVPLLDLNDPAVRQKFVDSFAPGSFGSPQPPHDVPDATVPACS